MSESTKVTKNESENIADDAMQMDVHKTLLSFLHYKENAPCYGNNHRKNASLAAIAMYISIRKFTQYAICRFSTQGISFQVSIAMICKERSIGLPWYLTKPQIMTLFYLASRAAPSWYIQLNMFLKISGGNCPVDLPLIARSASKTCQHHVETRAANLWDLSKAINKTLLVFGNFFTVKAHHTQTGQLRRPVCWHDYGQLTRIRTPRRFCKIDLVHCENSLQQI